MRLAWFTPLPPMPSGISDYSAELLPLLAERAEVEVFCPPSARRLHAPAGIAVRSPEAFDPSAFDATVYHLGNNPQHGFIYETALRHPGICVFHDLSLHHLIAHLMIEDGWDPARYRALCAEELGPGDGGRLAALMLSGATSGFEKFLFPLIGRSARRASAIVVHSRWGRERIRMVAPDVPVAVIPHHAGVPPPELDGVGRAEARRALGIPAEGFLVGHFGFLGAEKQPRAVLGGLAHLRRSDRQARLLVVGADHTGGGLARAARTAGVAEAVRTTGFVSLTEFYRALRAVDAVVNLRYPTAGESSGTLARALAESRAVIVNRLHVFAELPDEVALKVEVDGPQAEQVGAHLARLASDPAFRAGMESRAGDHAATTLDPRACRDAYLSLAERVSAPGLMVR